MLARRLWIALLVPALFTGCALSSIQSARPTPKGQLDVTLSCGLGSNEPQSSEATPILNIAGRYGITDHLDIGLAPFLLEGGLLDVKGNLFGPSNAFALSGQIGFGGGKDVLGDAGAGPVHLPPGGGAVHVPMNLLASYDVSSVLTPYVNLGYGAFWFFRGDARGPQQDVRDARRKPFRDGVLMTRAGLEVRFYHRSAVLLEVGWNRLIVEGPGDYHPIRKGYTAQLGLRF